MASGMARQLAKNVMRFIDASPSPYHAVEVTQGALHERGYERLREGNQWASQVKRGGKYYLTRNASSLIAFAVGGSYSPSGGFRITGAHTDSPALKLKPQCGAVKEGYEQVLVQPYGGGQWCTWFDRDLKIAGRVVLRDGRGALQHSLVHVNRPLLRIPTLAIHLNRGLNENGFKFNLETEMVPIIASSLSQRDTSSHSAVITTLAEQLQTSPEDIVDYDLVLADCQPSSLGGSQREFIFAPRLDNLLMSYLSLHALLETDSSLPSEEGVRMCVLFDNEEVGSTSYAGANSDFIGRAIERVAHALDPSNSESGHVAFRNSFLLSADMAHAVHPNFASKHVSDCKPRLQGGLVLKANANMRYATTGVTSAVIRELARVHNVKIQDFVPRNDMGCGSTIGPSLSARGLRTVDIGQPQLSMHSIREMCGVDDCEDSWRLLTSYYEHFGDIDKQFRLLVD